MTLPYGDCAHNYVDDSHLPELAVRCTECGDRVVAMKPECVHPPSRVLHLPDFGISYTASLRLRQCADCRLIGIADQLRGIVWMQEVGP